MNATRIRLGLLALTLAVSSAASAAECSLRIVDGWIRLPPAAMPMMAGFGRIENPCAKPATITGASSAAFGEVEMHETTVVDGVSRMRPVPTLRIAAKQSALFKPGGLHLMLMQPVAFLRENDRIAIDFTMANGRKVRGEFVVRNAAAK